MPSLDALIDPSRGADAPHPFYLSDPDQRDDVFAKLFTRQPQLWIETV